MIDSIYDFILNTLLGNPSFEGAETMAMLLTYTTIIMCFMLLIKIMMCVPVLNIKFSPLNKFFIYAKAYKKTFFALPK